jgi:hypothetical protein
MSTVVMLRCRIEKCGKIAQALILSGAEDPSGGEVVLAFPVCADHGPEAAHETASSMNVDEFLIVELPTFGVGGLT